MGLVELTISPRSTTGKNANRRTRAAGQIPAVLYGSGKASTNVVVDANELRKIMAGQSGHSVIFALQQEGVDEQPIAGVAMIQSTYPRHPSTLSCNLENK